MAEARQGRNAPEDCSHFRAPAFLICRVKVYGPGSRSDMGERAKSMTYCATSEREQRRERMRFFLRQAADELGSWLHGLQEPPLSTRGGRESKSGRASLLPRGGRRSFARHAEQALDPLLPAGDVHLDALAARMGLSRRTLQRRLAAEGLTFEGLVERVRRRRATRCLRRTAMPVKELAYRLGFADPSTFSRAFKRWTGASPSDWRNGLRRAERSPLSRRRS